MIVNRQMQPPMHYTASTPQQGPEAGPGAFPEEMFTPEVLEACPHARKMFEQMKSAQPPVQALRPQPNQSWVESHKPGNFTAKTAAPAAESWPSAQEIGAVLQGAEKNVADDSRTGNDLGRMRKFARERIDEVQRRQFDRGEECMHRLVHAPQLHGGEVEVHWNPNFEQHLNMFGLESQGGLIRISDASNEKNPDGASMYGVALRLVGNEGSLTDILMTGGTDRTEASQSKDDEAQLAIFNMLDHPFKPAGLVQMAWEVGPIETAGMIRDVGAMKTEIDTVAGVTAWSRAPFRLTAKNSEDKYLVKMRVVPVADPGGPVQEPQGETTTEQLTSEFDQRHSNGEVRWRFELQFMEPGDDPNDARETWKGPWLAAGEVVIPQKDPATAEAKAQMAEDTKFSVWTGKEPHNRGADAEVFDPHGRINQVRLHAYGMSAANRGVKEE